MAKDTYCFKLQYLATPGQTVFTFYSDEAQLETCQTSKMEFLEKKVNSFELLTSTPIKP